MVLVHPVLGEGLTAARAQIRRLVGFSETSQTQVLRCRMEVISAVRRCHMGEVGEEPRACHLPGVIPRHLIPRHLASSPTLTGNFCRMTVGILCDPGFPFPLLNPVLLLHRSSSLGDFDCSQVIWWSTGLWPHRRSRCFATRWRVRWSLLENLWPQPTAQQEYGFCSKQSADPRRLDHFTCPGRRLKKHRCSFAGSWNTSRSRSRNDEALLHESCDACCAGQRG